MLKIKGVTKILSGALITIMLGSGITNSAYSVMIAQGNTIDAGDCAAIYEGFNSYSSYNNNKLNRGWSYNGGRYSVNNVRANSSDFVSARDVDVLYWSGHGGKSKEHGPSLNVDAPTYGGGKYPFNVPNTLNLSLENNRWSGGSLKVLILSACNQLDNASGGAKWYAKAMRNSNIRVIIGYHEPSPTHHKDTFIARKFISEAKNGQSVRYAWQLANSDYAKSEWAALVYQSNNNQYYRIPGFPGSTYAAPTSKNVYRYRENTPPQLMERSLNNIDALPLTLEISEKTEELEVSRLTQSVNAISTSVDESTVVIREMSQPDNLRRAANISDNKAIVDEFLNSSAIGMDIKKDGILNVSDVIVSEIDPENGEIPGSESIIGKTYTYSNQYNGIRIADNFIKVATDEEGIYFVTNHWKKLDPAQEEGDERSVRSISLLNQEDANFIISDRFGTEIVSSQIVYALRADGKYRLSYEIESNDTIYYVDAQTGEIKF